MKIQNPNAKVSYVKRTKIKMHPAGIIVQKRYDKIGENGQVIKSEVDHEAYIRIYGDTPVESTSPKTDFLKGLVKGALIGVGGCLYIPLNAGYRAIIGAMKTASCADVPDKKVVEASLKGGALGFLKGTFHGVLDYAFIEAGITACCSALGPMGLTLSPVIVGLALSPAVGAGYNVIKQRIRRALETDEADVISKKIRNIIDRVGEKIEYWVERD